MLRRYLTSRARNDETVAEALTQFPSFVGVCNPRETVVIVVTRSTHHHCKDRTGDDALWSTPAPPIPKRGE